MTQTTKPNNSAAPLADETLEKFCTEIDLLRSAQDALTRSADIDDPANRFKLAAQVKKHQLNLIRMFKERK